MYNILMEHKALYCTITVFGDKCQAKAWFKNLQYSINLDCMVDTAVYNSNVWSLFFHFLFLIIDRPI